MISQDLLALLRCPRDPSHTGLCSPKPLPLGAAGRAGPAGAALLKPPPTGKTGAGGVMPELPAGAKPVLGARPPPAGKPVLGARPPPAGKPVLGARPPPAGKPLP